MRTIALIIPYFGSLPPWIDLFFHSCGRNSTVDFHLFTDADVAAVAPNVHVHRISYADYCQRASEALHIQFELPPPV